MLQRIPTPRILTSVALLAVLLSLVGAAGHAGARHRGPQAEQPVALASTATLVPALAPAAPPALERPAAAAGELDRLAALAPTLDREVLRLALAAHRSVVSRGLAEHPELLTVIDYSRPSTEDRLWVFDLPQGKLLFQELVAHGKNTGDKMARSFSNRNGSLQTSLGVFLTADTYHGGNGYSLRLRGLDRGYNDQALARAIVMHGAPYVSRQFAAQHGRIGRSWGCPAVRPEVARQMIDTLAGGSVVFSYFPDREWLGGSPFLAAVRAAR
jgi:hypothetical protein